MDNYRDSRRSSTRSVGKSPPDIQITGAREESGRNERPEDHGNFRRKSSAGYFTVGIPSIQVDDASDNDTREEYDSLSKAGTPNVESMINNESDEDDELEWWRRPTTPDVTNPEGSRAERGREGDMSPGGFLLPDLDDYMKSPRRRSSGNTSQEGRNVEVAASSHPNDRSSRESTIAVPSGKERRRSVNDISFNIQHRKSVHEMTPKMQAQIAKFEITPDDNDQVQPRSPTRGEYDNDRRRSSTRDEIDIGGRRSSTKDEFDDGRRRSSTRDEYDNSRRRSSTRDETDKGGRRPSTRDEYDISRRRSSTRDESDKGGRRPSTRDEYDISRRRSSTRDESGRGSRRLSAKDEFDNDRRRSSTRDEAGISIQRLSTRDEYDNGRRRSSTRDESDKGGRRLSTRDEYDNGRRRSSTRDESGRDSRRLPTRDEFESDRRRPSTRDEVDIGSRRLSTREEYNSSRRRSSTRGESINDHRRASIRDEVDGDRRWSSTADEQPDMRRRPSLKQKINEIEQERLISEDIDALERRLSSHDIDDRENYEDEELDEEFRKSITPYLKYRKSISQLEPYLQYQDEVTKMTPEIKLQLKINENGQNFEDISSGEVPNLKGVQSSYQNTDYEQSEEEGEAINDRDGSASVLDISKQNVNEKPKGSLTTEVLNYMVRRFSSEPIPDHKSLASTDPRREDNQFTSRQSDQSEEQLQQLAAPVTTPTRRRSSVVLDERWSKSSVQADRESPSLTMTLKNSENASALTDSEENWSKKSLKANLATGSPRGSSAGLETRSPRGSSAGLETRSPRGSSAGLQTRSPRGSSAGLETRSPRGSSAGLETRSPRGSSVGLETRSPRGSSVGLETRSPRGSLVGLETRSPRGSSAGLETRSPRGSSAGLETRSPRGSSAGRESRSPRGSSAGLEPSSPRGSLTSSDTRKSPRGSITSLKTPDNRDPNDQEALEPEDDAQVEISNEPRKSIGMEMFNYLVRRFSGDEAQEPPPQHIQDRSGRSTPEIWESPSNKSMKEMPEGAESPRPTIQTDFISDEEIHSAGDSGSDLDVTWSVQQELEEEELPSTVIEERRPSNRDPSRSSFKRLSDHGESEPYIEDEPEQRKNSGPLRSVGLGIFNTLRRLSGVGQQTIDEDLRSLEPDEPSHRRSVTPDAALRRLSTERELSTDGGETRSRRGSSPILESRSPRGSSAGLESRSPRGSSAGLKPRSPRGSSAGLESRSPRGSSVGLESRSPRGSSAGLEPRSPRGSSAGLESRSPRGSSAGLESRSPRGSSAGLETRSPRGSSVGLETRSPRGSSAGRESRSPRGSSAGLESSSPRGSLTSSDTRKSPRGSITSLKTPDNRDPNDQEALEPEDDAQVEISNEPRKSIGMGTFNQLVGRFRGARAQEPPPQHSHDNSGRSTPSGGWETPSNESMEEMPEGAGSPRPTIQTNFISDEEMRSAGDSGSDLDVTWSVQQELEEEESHSAVIEERRPSNSELSRSSFKRLSDHGEGEPSVEDEPEQRKNSGPLRSVGLGIFNTLRRLSGVGQQTTDEDLRSLEPDEPSHRRSVTPDAALRRLSTENELRTDSEKARSRRGSSAILESRSPRGSSAGLESRSPRGSSVGLETRSPRGSSVGLETRSPRGSSAGLETRSPRGSSAGLESRSPRGSSVGLETRSPRGSSVGLETRSPRGSSLGLETRSPRGSSAGLETRSPRGSSVGLESRSPRGSSVGLETRSPRGSSVGLETRSPRGSSAGRESRSPRGSSAGLESSSPRGSLTSSDTRKSPRGSITSLKTPDNRDPNDQEALEPEDDAQVEISNEPRKSIGMEMFNYLVRRFSGVDGNQEPPQSHIHDRSGRSTPDFWETPPNEFVEEMPEGTESPRPTIQTDFISHEEMHPAGDSGSNLDVMWSVQQELEEEELPSTVIEERRPSNRDPSRSSFKRLSDHGESEPYIEDEPEQRKNSGPLRSVGLGIFNTLRRLSGVGQQTTDEDMQSLEPDEPPYRRSVTPDAALRRLSTERELRTDGGEEVDHTWIVKSINGVALKEDTNVSISEHPEQEEITEYYQLDLETGNLYHLEVPDAYSALYQRFLTALGGSDLNVIDLELELASQDSLKALDVDDPPQLWSLGKQLMNSVKRLDGLNGWTTMESINKDKRKKPVESITSVTFCGCGFLGVYLVGAATYMQEHTPQILKGRLAGSSVGSLIATCLVCDVPLQVVRESLITTARESRKYLLGAFNPFFPLEEPLLRNLLELLPEDAHIRASGRLFLSLTRAATLKNEVVSEYETRDELLRAVLCCCFLPGLSGFSVPTFQGRKYVDGGISNNMPLKGASNLSVNAFAGGFDICPEDEKSYGPTRAFNQTLDMSMENGRKFFEALLPPDDLDEYYHQGYNDAKLYLSSS